MKHTWSTESTKANAIVVTLCLFVGLMLTACSLAVKPSYPGQSWQKVTTPETVGRSSVKLKLAQAYSESICSEAIMSNVNGEILWGLGLMIARLTTFSHKEGTP